MNGVEVAVVGAGITGLAVAREVRDRGRSVAVLERDGIAAGASGVQPGGVRQQWGTRIACRLARESVAFWREVDERLAARVPLALRSGGYLFAAEGEAALAGLEANVALQNEEGIRSRIVGPAEAADLVPGLVADAIAGGAWLGEDGYFDRPQAVVEAFAQGLDVRRADVGDLRRDGSGWRAGPVTADAVVVAAGVDTPALLATLGIELPIEAESRYLFFSDPIRERLLEPLVVAAERGFAAKQLADGRVLASDLSARGDAEAGRERWRATIRAASESLLPQLEHVSYPLLVHGAYDVTPDHQPILGPVDEGLFVAAGFSGHGFMIAPAVARITADAVEGRHDPALDLLGAGRFAAGRLVSESQLV
ncbi:MAG: FAD-binding oxidoreductase [Acidobacteriota bacterium]|nr:FAD-binding oxidoreductase [Acidobacteriota bacterium]